MKVALCKLGCEACREGAPLVTPEEKQQFLPQIPCWQIIDVNDIEQLFRTFSFDNYPDALQFTNCVAALAEKHQHHPAIRLEWGRVDVYWWTHKIKGLHKNDFILAALTDTLLATKS